MGKKYVLKEVLNESQDISRFKSLDVIKPAQYAHTP